MAISNSLYPPIIDTYMPAFIITDNICKVYFALSKYNNPENIKSVWITINNQYTNKSVLNTSTGLKAFSLGDPDPSKNSDDRYYVTISAEDIIGGWELNQLYKVQLRFSTLDPNKDWTMSEIVANEDSFSEWSTVSLIQGIQKPKLTLINFENSVGTEVIFTSMNNIFAGYVDNLGDNDNLNNYHIKIYNKKDLDTIVYDSGVCYTDEFNPNEINHFVKYGFIDGEHYIMNVSYQTASLFEETLEYLFLIIDLDGESLNANITAEQDEDNGRIKVRIHSDTEKFVGNITIRRTSSDSNFEVWEDIHTTAVIDDNYLDLIWYDNTVESGIWYKYCAQRRNRFGDRGLIISTKEPVMVTLQDMFLTRADKQLKIQFKPQVGSFKRTVSESLTQTLGSKYPFIRRNGKVNFRQFSISGLISHFSDKGDPNWWGQKAIQHSDWNELFCSKSELYRGYEELYEKYNSKNRITEYNDFSLEKTFREKVMDFLYANDAKLFRSPSEGNILVRLMDISFTPETQLGRMVYSFSATAYEIDECNFENYSKYGIQNVGTYNDSIFRTYEKSSQISGDFHIQNKPSQWIELKTIAEEKEKGLAMKGVIKEIISFNKIKLAFLSEPYLINVGQDIPITVQEFLINEANKKETDEKGINIPVLGYLIQVNGETIVVNSKGHYEIIGDNVDITSFKIYNYRYENGNTVNVQFDYSCKVREIEDTAGTRKTSITYVSRVGQVRGYYEPNESIYDKINEKYDQVLTGGYQKLFTLNEMTIEAEQDNVFYIKDSFDNKYRRYVIGSTGLLHIINEDFTINGIYSLGTHLVEKPKDSNGKPLYERTKDNEWADRTTDKLFNSVLDISTPVKNGVYRVSSLTGVYNPNFIIYENNYFEQLGNMLEPFNGATDEEKIYRVIYYNNAWYLFSRTDDVIKPNQVLIDYYYELERGTY